MPASTRPSRPPRHTARWVGAQGGGARDYTDVQARQVVELLREHVTGRANAISSDDFHTAFVAALGISPRAFRAIVSDRDGIDFLVANEGNGRLYLCETADEGEATTARLAARAQTELRRVSRRRAFAVERLGRRQGLLFSGEGAAQL